MKHTKCDELAIVHAATVHDSLCLTALADWDGMVEIGQCAVVDDQGTVERIDGFHDQHTFGGTFWSVYLHQNIGGVDCIADFTSEQAAGAFSAGLIAAREWALRCRECIA